MRKRIIFFVGVLLLFVQSVWAAAVTDYSKAENWAFLADKQDKSAAVDVFFICPTVLLGEPANMSLDNEQEKSHFYGAINMERGIYAGGTRFFAPYYRQKSMECCTASDDPMEPYHTIAYTDVKAAFEYYLTYFNCGRPFILAGFSQGAEMAIELLVDYFDNEELQNKLVACYAVGWRYPADKDYQVQHIRPAQGETDTGVLICFNSEAPDIGSSILVPKGYKTVSINPLNWRTDSKPADESLNKGACFTNYRGEIFREIPQYVGGYIDKERGTLKVTELSDEERQDYYFSVLPMLPSGVYHIYDYQFYYRNLQENVQKRIAAYKAAH